MKTTTASSLFPFSVNEQMQVEANFGSDAEYYEQDGHTMLSGLSLMGWFATGSSIAMVEPPYGKGSAYMWTYTDANGDWLDGSKTYKMTMPAPIPAANFWSTVVYDVWTRSMLANGEAAASLNQYADGVTASDDGSIELFFGPEPPVGNEGNPVAC